MKIKFGYTRMVFIFSRYVVKIPRIRIIRLVCRFFKHASEGNLGNKIAEHKINGKFILLQFIIPGLLANWREYKYSKKNPEEKAILPVKMLLFGFIEIQERGEYIPRKHKKWKKVKAELQRSRVEDTDLLVRRNYSLSSGRIVLHDYGNLPTLNEIGKATKIIRLCNGVDI